MFVESPAAFLKDFGIGAFAGAVPFTVIFEAVGSDILSGRAQNTDYEITYLTSAVPTLLYGNSVTISGVPYTVLTSNLLDDGVFSKARLQAT
jgi:hypothetical protein